MRRSIVLNLSLSCSLFSSLCLAGSYQIPPASTSVKIDANTTLLQDISRAREKLAEASEKGLVFIFVSKTLKMSNNDAIDPFEFFFGGQAPMTPRQQPRQEGLGSGFIVDLDKGYIMTNNHVVDGADKILVTLANRSTYDAKIVGHDKDTDVAVIQIVDKNFTRKDVVALVLGDSDSISIGSSVLAFGAPFSLKATVTEGIISAVGRGNLSLTKMGDFIQTDAAINPGNSGGPLINMEGKVIGINSAIFSQSGAYAGIGFAIPSNIARRIATSLIDKGSFYKGYVGIGYEPLRDEWVSNLDLPKGTKGIIIGEVVAGSPADKAGIEPGDVIVALDGKTFEPDNVTSLIGLKEPGTPIEFTIYRQGKKQTVNLTVSTAPSANEARVASSKSGKKSLKKSDTFDRFGFKLEAVNESLRSQYGLTVQSGLVIVSLETASRAWREGFREGDVITRVNGKVISSVSAFEAATKGKEVVLLQINRKGRSLFAQLRSEEK